MKKIKINIVSKLKDIGQWIITKRNLRKIRKLTKKLNIDYMRF